MNLEPLRIPGTICRHPRCGKEIGRDEYILVMDGITNRIEHFHAACAPTRQKQPDLQRHYGAHLNPGNLLSVGKDL